MYSAKYKSNITGDTFSFGYSHGNIFDIADLTQMSVSLAKSQGFNQKGETVENASVPGRTLTITGKFIGETLGEKGRMLKTFAPLSTGRLIFEDKFYIDCNVLKSPSIAARKENPAFSMQLFAPYPFWRRTAENSYSVSGVYDPAFHFPVNYAIPHWFGIKDENRFINCSNNGEVEAVYKVTFRTRTATLNPQILNVKTGEYLRLMLQLNKGEEVSVYRDGNRLKAERSTNGITEDIFGTIEEDSSLFYMHVGDNIIRATADDGEEQLITTIQFSDTVVGVYEGM